MDKNVTICDQRCYPNIVRRKAREVGDIFVLVGPNWTLSDICSELCGATLRYRVHLLRIVAHGMPQQIQLGQGLRTGNTRTLENIRGIWVDPTTRQVHPSPRIDCHSCQASATTRAAGIPTPRVIVQQLANSTGVRVRCGEVNQLVDSLFNFTGRVNTMIPTPPRPITSADRQDPETALQKVFSRDQRVESLRSRARRARSNRERVAAVENLIPLIGFPQAQEFGRSVGVYLTR
jgi:hypothetical protein